jgi:hypothetical protein
MIGGSRSRETLSTPTRDRQLPDDAVEPDPEPLDVELFEPVSLEPEPFEPELSDFVVVDDVSLDDEPLSELDELPALASPVVDADAAVEADFLPRLSVLKKPEPLKVTPTGVKTFLTGSTSPLSGWAISVRLSSWKPCWTSMVSPESTNL